MRLLSFMAGSRPGFGALLGNSIVRLDGPGGAPDLKGYLAQQHGCWSLPDCAETLALADVTLLPPVPNPSKIFCVAVNFHEPARAGKPVPEYPLLFTRIPEGQVGHEAAILKPAVSEMFDFEGEMAVVIGRAGRQIAREDALQHVAGFSCFNDGSVRDWQKHSTQFTPGKNFMSSGAFGPWLVTADEIADWRELNLITRVNGVQKQAISMRDMIFDVPWLIAYCSTFAPLQPGDVIVTGTPSGFGSSRDPAEFLAPGDLIEIEISGIGVLRNEVHQDVDSRNISKPS